MKKHLNFLLSKILVWLRVRPPVGGIEISDTTLRFTHFDGKQWHLAAMQLEPGTLEFGKIKDYSKFVKALKNLKANIPFAKKSQIPVVVSLSSINIYSQVFNIPIIQGESLDRAIQLNVQMASPMEIGQAYSGWQIVEEDHDALKLGVLSAFIERGVVDETTKSLREAGFGTVVVESPALALARLVRERGNKVGIDITKPHILMSIDGSGINFLIIRRGQLYFEYFNPWRDVMDDKGEISGEAFEMVVVRNLRQVMNFYSQHWTEPLGEVILSATALKEEAQRIISQNAELSVQELQFDEVNVSPEWFSALGCGIRGRNPRSKDTEMSLLGVGAQEEFHREQLVLFLRFWRVLMPVSLTVLLGAFALTHLFLKETRTDVEAESLFRLGNVSASSESMALKTKAQDFNRLVGLFKAVRGVQTPKSLIIGELQAITSGNGVNVTRIYFQNPESPITLTGNVRSEDRLTAFKAALEESPKFKEVNLNLSDVRQGLLGLDFSITFRIEQ